MFQSVAKACLAVVVVALTGCGATTPNPEISARHGRCECSTWLINGQGSLALNAMPLVDTARYDPVTLSAQTLGEPEVPSRSIEVTLTPFFETA